MHKKEAIILSAPQLISPLLDGFVMGDPISNHDGVRSCPAVHLETDKKYIIKIISVPASQSKLDALLLAGAFSDRASAEEYFKELADDVLHETEVLQNLSKHEGFVSFEDLQMIPMQEGETGYDIYLLGQYRDTLDGVLRTNEMTHLQAINLSLDLCAALSAARRLGYIYSNLKPSNIFLCNEREFRIGDLGFLKLDSLQFASLPDKYRSDYTPVEISDAYASLNSTMDTYAVGLILYQAYNDGKLPVVGGELEAPVHADPALTEIILKACALDPAERWEDPVQMGQALANYMQSNPVNDIPIVPVSEEDSEPQEVFPDEDTEPSTDDILTEVDQALEAAPPIPCTPEPEKAEETPQDDTNDKSVEETPDDSAAEPVEEIPEEVSDDEPTEDTVEEEPEVCEAEETTEEVPQDEPEAEEVTEDATVEDETTQILAQADDLIAHQLPDPPVAPEPFEVMLPEKEEPEPESLEEEIPSEVDASEEESDPVPAEEAAADDAELPESESDKEFEETQDETPKPKNKRKGLVVTAIILAAVLLLGTATALFYQYFYLQTIDGIVLIGDANQLTVQLTTDVADDKLTVKCTDTHGNALTAPVKDGVAQFSDLRFGTAYTLEVRISGFHKLIGETTRDFTTTAQTVINGFYAVTGPEDGSVILSFTPQGPASEQWSVSYVAEGETERSVTFAGPVVTLTGLTVGKEYTFTLSPVEQIYISGTNTITYTASSVVYAQNLRIPGFEDGNLTIAWDAPEGVTVPQWHVRCYNEAGFEKTATTEDTFVIFDGIDITSGYTIEVIADGMSLGTRMALNAGSILITNVTADSSDPTQLKVTWEFEGNAPDGGWVLQYTVDGVLSQTVTCDGTSAVISPLIPGASYSISIKPASDTTYFGGNLEYESEKASAFSGYLVTAEDMEFSMCKTPSKKGWDYKDVPNKNYTTSFKVGVSASFVMHVKEKTSQTQDVVTTLYVVRDADGKLVSAKTESRTWDDMWDNRYGELTLPVMPETPGNYTVEIYFNGTSATTQSFTILASN